jgi:type I restriction-modification system DNA methylase subunit
LTGKRALVIGISNYDNLESLNFCKNDGLEMVQVLTSLNYELHESNKLLGSVRWEMMRDAIYDFFSNENIKPTDTLLFYYSGHGIPDNDQDVFLATSDIDPNVPSKRGFNFNELTKVIRNCTSTSIVAILDCCYSGSAKISKGHEDDAARLGSSTISRQSENVAIRGEGKCILAASQAQGEAYALEEHNHSVFTYYLLQILKGAIAEAIDNYGNVTVDSLSRSIYNTIMSLPPSKRPKQRPVRKLEASGDIVLAYYPQLSKSQKESNRIIPESIKQQLEFLIKKYRQIIADKRINKYNEENTKAEFIEPLFEILGWDVRNRSYQDEVTREEKISKNRVDYSFRINGIPKFFLEAKALRENLDNEEFIKKAITYSWNKGCTWAVLTDFESVKIFNAEWQTEDLFQNHLKTIQYYEFVDRYQELSLLSKDSFEKGLLDKEAEKWGKRTKRGPVDEQLLLDFTYFRNLLYKNIRKINRFDISQNDLEESVQRILDRLIFIRNCEDREIEERQLISNLREWENKGKGELIKKIREVFEYFDNHYNSKIFAKHQCDSLEIDNKILYEIIERLYYTPDRAVSYDFSAIEADVLGNIYEQYVGLLKRGEKRAVLTENEIRRKHHGIYYTPTYIVDFIVRNTLGNLLEHKKTDPYKIRILDPACGSGSFLIKAFDVFNDYYRKRDKDYSQTQLDLDVQSGTYTTKTRILQNNIFGVDLDKQAVEIAQLNLLLKIAEKAQRLPLLNKNIKQGNSLIEYSFEQEDMPLNWKSQFPEIIQQGGFDVIIGNPPYIRSQTAAEKDKKYYKDNYISAKGRYDIYVLFIERSLRLLKKDGLLGFIIPNKFTQAEYGEPIKKFIMDNFWLRIFVDFGDLKVFEEATTYPSIIVVQNSKPTSKSTYMKVKQLTPQLKSSIYENIQKEHYEDDLVQVFSFEQKSLNNWNFVSPTNLRIIKKIENNCKMVLKDIRDQIYEGLITGNNNIFFVKKEQAEKLGIEPELLKPVPKARNVRKYKINWEEEYVIYPYTMDNNKAIPVSIGRYKNVYEYLFPHRLDLRKRPCIIEANKSWFELCRPRVTNWFTQDKIITPNLAPSNSFAYDFADNEAKQYFYLDHDCYGITLKNKDRPNYLYVLGILNSLVVEFLIKQSSPMFSGGFYKYHTQYLDPIPIPKIDNKKKSATKKQIIEMVTSIMHLNKEMRHLNQRTDKASELGNKIRDLEYKIDLEVFELYGLTKDDRITIEQFLKSSMGIKL